MKPAVLIGNKRMASELLKRLTMRRTLLIANISINCAEWDMKSWIEASGFRVHDVHLIRDAVSGTSPSFAQVELADPASIEDAARVLNGSSLMGRRLHVRPISQTALITNKHS